MKKIFLVLTLLLSAFVFADEEKKPVPTCYSINCYKCYEHAKKHNFIYSNPYSIAERRFECEKKDEYTMVYKCHYGHTLYINTKTGERK